MEAHHSSQLTHLCILRCAGTREVFLDLNQACSRLPAFTMLTETQFSPERSGSLSLPGEGTLGPCQGTEVATSEVRLPIPGMSIEASLMGNEPEKQTWETPLLPSCSALPQSAPTGGSDLGLLLGT